MADMCATQSQSDVLRTLHCGGGLDCPGNGMVVMGFEVTRHGRHWLLVIDFRQWSCHGPHFSRHGLVEMSKTTVFASPVPEVLVFMTSKFTRNTSLKVFAFSAQEHAQVAVPSLLKEQKIELTSM